MYAGGEAAADEVSIGWLDDIEAGTLTFKHARELVEAKFYKAAEGVFGAFYKRTK